MSDARSSNTYLSVGEASQTSPQVKLRRATIQRDVQLSWGSIQRYSTSMTMDGVVDYRSLKVSQTHFTVGFIMDLLNDKDERWDYLVASRTLQEIRIKDVGEFGRLSHVVRIVFVFEYELESFSVVLKVPKAKAPGSPMQGRQSAHQTATSHDHLMTLHNTEVQFYTNIQQEKIDLFLPRIFHSVCATCATADELEDSFILMEDLTRKAGHANVLEGLTKGQVESAIKAVAKFHAHSLKMPPDMVQKLAQSQAMTNGYPSTVNGHSDLASDKDHLLKRLLTLPFEYFRQHDKALRNLFSTAKTPNYDDMLKHYGIPAVLGHGEFWAANIFFAKDPHEQVTDEVYALFDWQTPKLGAGVADVGLLILTSTNSNLKLRYLDDWLALYHETFVQYVRTYKLKVLCTLEQIREMFYFYYPSLTVSVLEHVMRLYDEATDIKVQTALMGRMISTFEMIRKDFEGDDLDVWHRRVTSRRHKGARSSSARSRAPSKPRNVSFRKAMHAAIQAEKHYMQAFVQREGPFVAYK